MSKIVRLIVAVALDSAAKVANALQAVDAVQSVTMEAEPEPIEVSPLDQLKAALASRQTAPEPSSRSNRVVSSRKRSPLAGRAVVYSTVGGKRKIDALLADMKRGSLSAFVLRFVAKHDGADKRSIIDAAVKAGFNGESVDNVVWGFQKRAASAGVGIKSEAAE